MSPATTVSRGTSAGMRPRSGHVQMLCQGASCIESIIGPGVSCRALQVDNKDVNP